MSVATRYKVTYLHILIYNEEKLLKKIRCCISDIWIRSREPQGGGGAPL